MSNDDGSPILLIRNDGKSRKASYPFQIVFMEDKEVLINTSTNGGKYSGHWKWGGDQITVSVSLKNEKSIENNPAETYKYFLTWGEDRGPNLHLEKMLIIRPFLNDDGTRRQSCMSSLIFSDRPVLKPI